MNAQAITTEGPKRKLRAGYLVNAKIHEQAEVEGRRGFDGSVTSVNAEILERRKRAYERGGLTKKKLHENALQGDAEKLAQGYIRVKTPSGNWRWVKPTSADEGPSQAEADAEHERRVKEEKKAERERIQMEAKLAKQKGPSSASHRIPVKARQETPRIQAPVQVPIRANTVNDIHDETVPSAVLHGVPSHKVGGIDYGRLEALCKYLDTLTMPGVAVDRNAGRFHAPFVALKFIKHGMGVRGFTPSDWARAANLGFGFINEETGSMDEALLTVRGLIQWGWGVKLGLTAVADQRYHGDFGRLIDATPIFVRKVKNLSIEELSPSLFVQAIETWCADTSATAEEVWQDVADELNPPASTPDLAVNEEKTMTGSAAVVTLPSEATGAAVSDVGADPVGEGRNEAYASPELAEASWRAALGQEDWERAGRVVNGVLNGSSKRRTELKVSIGVIEDKVAKWTKELEALRAERDALPEPLSVEARAAWVKRLALVELALAD